MVSKESSHLLTSQSNGKNTLADKLPGTMTVRSVLLNRDSPDIESRLKKRRNRTHQVRFKDLEDGSSSSGNSGTGDNSGHQKTTKDCASPYPVRKHGSRTPLPWVDDAHISSLPGQTSVVGAVRGDMASTIEVVAAFLARAPPHPLTPGPTRKCWTPPQANSLTLPLTRKTSTSTAIQTSPCLKKPFATHTRSQSLGDSVAIDGDDEHDSQEENCFHNHMSAHKPKDPNGSHGCPEQTIIERKSKSRTEMKSAVTVVKNARHSCPSSVSHTELCHCCTVPCRESAKRQGSSTPSLVRRRKRFSRTTSDPGKEVHYCTTPTQTDSHSLSPPRSSSKLCTTHVQTECPSSYSDPKNSITLSQNKSQITDFPDIDPTLSLPTNIEGSQIPTKSASHPTPTVLSAVPCPTKPQIISLCASKIFTTSVNTMQNSSESMTSSLGKNQDPLSNQTVPYSCNSITPDISTYTISYTADEDPSSKENTSSTKLTELNLSSPCYVRGVVTPPPETFDVTFVTSNNVNPSVTPAVSPQCMTPALLPNSDTPIVSKCSEFSDAPFTVITHVTKQDVSNCKHVEDPVVTPTSDLSLVSLPSITSVVTPCTDVKSLSDTSAFNPQTIPSAVFSPSLAPVITSSFAPSVVIPCTVSPVVTSPCVLPDVTPQIISSEVFTRSVSPVVTLSSVTLNSVAGLDTQHSVFPDVTSPTFTTVVTSPSVTTVVTSLSVTPVFSSHSAISAVTSSSVAPIVTPHCVTPNVTTYNVTPNVTTSITHDVTLPCVPPLVTAPLTPVVRPQSFAPVVIPQSIPTCSTVTQLASPSTAVILPVFSCSTSLSVIQDCSPPISNIYPSDSSACSSPIPRNPPIVSTNITDMTRHTPTQVNIIPLLPNVTSPTNVAPCTFVTQTAISCTSISYYTTTHPVGPIGPQAHIFPPAYATLVQTVSHCNIPCQVLKNTINTKLTPFSSPVPKLKSCTSQPILVKTCTSNLPIVQHCVTPTKKAPLYSSTFRAAPPYTPPCQTQDKRGIRLPPPPPPPPPPYTPRKNTNEQPATQTSMLRTDNKVTEKDKDASKDKKDEIKTKDFPKLSGRASSLKHRAQTPPIALIKEKGSPSKACLKSTCLSSAQAQLGVLHKILCSGARPRPNTPCQFPLPQTQQGRSRIRRCSVPVDCATTGPLTPAQADTLRQVQEILGGLMSGTKCKLDPSKVTEKLLGPNGPLRDIRSLQTQLQSLEGVLETSQNTIKVLLDVIQDLEKKEAVRDGHLYRTGQDIENCGTCRDCACIIYSVEHDFRLQEGQVVRTWKVGDPPEERPQTPTPPPSTPHQQDSPQAERPPVSAKKNRKKCFWFL